MTDKINKILCSDAFDGLKQLNDESVHCCVTSPPYWGLRDYGVQGQIGLEPTPEKYVENIVAVFREVKRVLIKEGTLWLNLGDSYGGSGKAKGDKRTNKYKQDTNRASINSADSKLITNYTTKIIKAKDLVGIPWMVAFALRADGWYLRQDIIWSKPNPMPESVKDRCTKSHEYIFLLSKSKKYFFDQDAIKTPLKDISIRRLIQNIENQKGSNRVTGKTNGNMKAVKPKKKFDHSMAGGGGKIGAHNGYFDENNDPLCSIMVNKKSVWEVTTKPFKDSHFATFPQDLIVDCIKAGCPIDGIVLDPFMGSGTTAIVASKLNRKYIGFELSPKNIKISERRKHKELGMFK